MHMCIARNDALGWLRCVGENRFLYAFRFPETRVTSRVALGAEDFCSVAGGLLSSGLFLNASMISMTGVVGADTVPAGRPVRETS